MTDVPLEDDVERNDDIDPEMLARLRSAAAGLGLHPTEIETFLTTRENLKSAQVGGVNRTGRGDITVAFVIPHKAQESSDADLIGFCSEGVANCKVPSRIVFLEQFPELAGPNGVEIQKTKLREIAETLVAQVVQTMRKQQEVRFDIAWTSPKDRGPRLASM